jgi:hypothetical protein
MATERTLAHTLSYDFVKFDRTTGERVYRLQHHQPAQHLSVNSRFFLRGIAQFDGSKRRSLSDLPRILRARAWNRGAPRLRFCLRKRRTTSVRSHDPRALLQGLLPGTLVVSRREQPAALEPREHGEGVFRSGGHVVPGSIINTPGERLCTTRELPFATAVRSRVGMVPDMVSELRLERIPHACVRAQPTSVDDAPRSGRPRSAQATRPRRRG